MAVKWAIVNGNWSAGATWNDGVVPTANDEVYLNGYNVTINVATITCLSISNMLSDYSTAGGYLNFNSITHTITADIYFSSNILRSTAYTDYNIINGNIYGFGGNFYQSGSINTAAFTINGNITLKNGSAISNRSNTGSVTISIIGSIVFYDNSFFTVGAYGSNISVNGSLELNSDSTTTSPCNLSFNGEIRTNEYTLTLPNITFAYGGIIANTYDEHRGLIVGQLTLSNPESFYWKNLAETIPDYPPESVVLKDYVYDNGNKTGTLTPVVLGDYPAEADVKVGVIFDYGNKVGTFQPVADYPAEADVSQGVTYAYGQMTGTLSVATDYPQEANVLQGVEYANGSMVGTLEVVQLQADYPSEDDVRFDVPFDFGNKQGKCHVPIPEDVRDGVLVDVNDVGTLIPSSGGDRLRIADFSYYTNAQSDTYIVDLTEQDKPKFAVAEERVLIEMFPDLDLENIPEKYFDDLFVKYLKYRLIVEYYRTAGINSTFTPSEPTTEIVNYQNVRNEVWLNSANIYLKAWSKKYPESIVKPHRILL